MLTVVPKSLDIYCDVTELSFDQISPSLLPPRKISGKIGAPGDVEPDGGDDNVLERSNSKELPSPQKSAPSWFSSLLHGDPRSLKNTARKYISSVKVPCSWIFNFLLTAVGADEGAGVRAAPQVPGASQLLRFTRVSLGYL